MRGMMAVLIGGLLACLATPCPAQLVMPNGSVIPRDRVDSAKGACAAGIVDACLVDAMAHRSGAGVPIDIDHAAAAFRKACEGGLGMGCEGEGEIAGYRHDAAMDPALAARRTADAIRLYDAGCTGGNGVACHRLATMLDQDGPHLDKPRAAALFSRACFDLNFGPACISGFYLTDLSVSPVADKALAARLAAAADPALDAGCRAGQAGWCAMLATWLDRIPATRDAARIARLADAACTAGVANGCVLSARQLASGTGAETWSRRLDLLDRACRMQLSTCAELVRLMQSAPAGQPVESHRIPLALMSGCLGDVDSNCWDLYDRLDELTGEDRRGAALTFAMACRNLPRPSAELCVVAARQHAGADRAEAVRLMQRALTLPEEADEPFAHDEARALLRSGR